jgi:hypothetical protein
MAIIKNDPTMATEIFVEIFTEIYKSLNEKDKRESLGLGVKNILGSSI